PRLPGTEQAVARFREAVEGGLATPRGGGHAAERRQHSLRVAAQVERSSVDERDDRLGGELCTEERGVDAFACERVDETCGVADQDAAAPRERIAGRSQRKSVAAYIVEPGRIEPERAGQQVQVFP